MENKLTTQEQIDFLEYAIRYYESCIIKNASYFGVCCVFAQYMGEEKGVFYPNIEQELKHSMPDFFLYLEKNRTRHGEWFFPRNKQGASTRLELLTKFKRNFINQTHNY